MLKLGFSIFLIGLAAGAPASARPDADVMIDDLHSISHGDGSIAQTVRSALANHLTSPELLNPAAAEAAMTPGHVETIIDRASIATQFAISAMDGLVAASAPGPSREDTIRQLQPVLLEINRTNFQLLTHLLRSPAMVGADWFLISRFGPITEAKAGGLLSHIGQERVFLTDLAWSIEGLAKRGEVSAQTSQAIAGLLANIENDEAGLLGYSNE